MMKQRSMRVGEWASELLRCAKCFKSLQVMKLRLSHRVECLLSLNLLISLYDCHTITKHFDLFTRSNIGATMSICPFSSLFSMLSGEQCKQVTRAHTHTNERKKNQIKIVKRTLFSIIFCVKLLWKKRTRAKKKQHQRKKQQQREEEERKSFRARSAGNYAPLIPTTRTNWIFCLWILSSFSFFLVFICSSFVCILNRNGIAWKASNSRVHDELVNSIVKEHHFNIKSKNNSYFFLLFLPNQSAHEIKIWICNCGILTT